MPKTLLLSTTKQKLLANLAQISAAGGKNSTPYTQYTHLAGHILSFVTESSASDQQSVAGSFIQTLYCS